VYRTEGFSEAPFCIKIFLVQGPLLQPAVDPFRLSLDLTRMTAPVVASLADCMTPFRPHLLLRSCPVPSGARSCARGMSRIALNAIGIAIPRQCAVADLMNRQLSWRRAHVFPRP